MVSPAQRPACGNHGQAGVGPKGDPDRDEHRDDDRETDEQTTHDKNGANVPTRTLRGFPMNLCAHPSTYPWDSSEALGHGYCHEGVPGQVSRMITFFFKSGEGS
jgi:hypothetical protein